MDETQASIMALQAALDEICHAMEPSELARFRDDFAGLIPAVAAAQDPRSTRKVLSDLRAVFGRYPQVRSRVMPVPGGQAVPPPSLGPRDQPIRDLTRAELAQAMQALCNRMDTELQRSLPPRSEGTSSQDEQR